MLIEWTDHRRSWATVGVSENVIEASWFVVLGTSRLFDVAAGKRVRAHPEHPRETGMRTA